jgi:hypothetical protein
MLIIMMGRSLYLFHTLMLLFRIAYLIYTDLQVHNRHFHEKDLVIYILENIFTPLFYR